MEKKEITLLNSEEIENITADNIKIDITTATHYNNLKTIIDLLENEKKAIEKAIFEKTGHKKFKNSMISISVYDQNIFSKDEFIKKYSIEEYEELKTGRKHIEKIVKFGK